MSYAQNNYATTGIALQPDGRVLTVGPTNGGGPSRFVARRHLGDGSLDTTFGNAGVVETSIAGRDALPGAVVLQADGKLLISGYSEDAFTPMEPRISRWHATAQTAHSIRPSGPAGGRRWTCMARATSLA